MIEVRSHSLGVDLKDEFGNSQRTVHVKRFKKFGICCFLYIILQKLLEDYIEVYERDSNDKN